jgi:hypothetical protein
MQAAAPPAGASEHYWVALDAAVQMEDAAGHFQRRTEVKNPENAGRIFAARAGAQHDLHPSSPLGSVIFSL